MHARACVCVTRARNPANDTTRRRVIHEQRLVSNLSQHRRHLDFKQLYIFRPAFGRWTHSVVMSLEARWEASGKKSIFRRGTHCLVGRDSAPIYGEFTSSRACSANENGEKKERRSRSRYFQRRLSATIRVPCGSPFPSLKEDTHENANERRPLCSSSAVWRARATFH